MTVSPTIAAMQHALFHEAHYRDLQIGLLTPYSKLICYMNE